MFSFLTHKDNYIFDMFDKMCVHLVDGAQILIQILERTSDNVELAKRLKSIEHDSDIVAHEIISHLHKTFITPIDREDIFHLVNRIDDILDLTEGAAARIILYDPKSVIEESKVLSRVLLESTRLIKEMVGLLNSMKKSDRILVLISEIKRLEREADIIRRSALSRLFMEEGDISELIKWKEILEFIEKGTDRCEDVGDITEGIVIENT